MKKIFGLLMIAAAVLFVAGNANASFSQGNLEEVVVDSNGNEYGQDLGALNVNATGNLGTSLNVNSTNVGNGLVTAFFFSYSVSGTTPVLDVWATSQPSITSWLKMNGTASGTPTNIGNYFNFANGQTFTNGWYSVGQATTGDFTSALGKTFDAFIGSSGALLTEGGSTTLNEYVFTGDGIKTVTPGSLAITISTSNSDVFQASGPAGSAAPIPPSVLLFGSGLLGLIGLKRRCS